MSFQLDSTNLKKAFDQEAEISVELDYTDSDNKLIIFKNIESQHSLIVVDNRNLSCNIYLKNNINPKVINSLPEALQVLGFDQNKIFFHRI